MQGGPLAFWQHAMIWGELALFQAKLPVFLWSWQDSNLWPRRCERRVLTNWTTRPCFAISTMCPLFPITPLCDSRVWEWILWLCKTSFRHRNANVTRSERARYIAVAKAARPRMVPYSFQSTMTRTTAHSRERNREQEQTITTVSAWWTVWWAIICQHQ